MAFAPFKSNMVGPPAMGGFTTPFTQGLGLPNGQAVFNLTGQGFQGNPMPQVNVNPGLNQPTNMKIDITRQVSSRPVQNIINDIINPLGNTNIDIGPQQMAAPKFGQMGSAPAGGQPQMGGFGGGLRPHPMTGLPWAPTAQPQRSQGFLAEMGTGQWLQPQGNPYHPLNTRVGGTGWF